MHRLVTGMARASAVIGGIALVVIIIMTCLSIFGRSVGLGEITGNYEILEAGVAFAIFAFFPICQLNGAHAKVDVFTSGLGPRAMRVLKAFWEVILALVIIFITWRLYDGMQRYVNNGETTLFLQFPVWWAYAASFAAACVASLTAVYTAAARVFESATGRSVLVEG